jgi:hypothetical protein
MGAKQQNFSEPTERFQQDIKGSSSIKGSISQKCSARNHCCQLSCGPSEKHGPRFAAPAGCPDRSET